MMSPATRRATHSRSRPTPRLRPAARSTTRTATTRTAWSRSPSTQARTRSPASNPASAVLERQTSALVGGTCEPFVGGWSPVTSPDTVPDSTCARYRYRVSDHVGQRSDLHAAVEHGEGRPHRSGDDHRRRSERPELRCLAVLRVLVRRARLDLRVPARRRRLERLHVARDAVRPGRRQPHVPGARDRWRRAHGPDARDLHVDDRHSPAEHVLRRRPARPVERRRSLLRVLRERARLDLRVPARRRRLGRVLEPRDDRAAPRRQPHVRGARHRRRRQRRRLTRLAHVDGGHGRSPVVVLGRPRRPVKRRDPDLRVLGERGRLELPVPRSTAAPGAPAPAPRTSARSPTAATPSRCARRTRPETRRPRPPRTPGSSTPGRRT